MEFKRFKVFCEDVTSRVVLQGFQPLHENIEVKEETKTGEDDTFVYKRLKYVWGKQSVYVDAAYTKDDKYIGDPKMARFLKDKYGIDKFELRTPESNICSIGYSPRNQKWYGWSHRAICGFGIGDKVFDETFGNDMTPYVSHGHRDIQNMEDAKESAGNFAEYVS